ncbi:Uncharacterized protein Adt_06110 [Abeliophyllum distichum]|uniref:RNase H type-1 domain-containing protein n=1 Tax=Abeliophyllum distichum TaxID=126358 RepID=A0ABD1V632_9LAMI
MVNQGFRGLVGRNIEAYVDDIVVKSRLAKDHIVDLNEVFGVARKLKLKLNPTKCVWHIWQKILRIYDHSPRPETSGRLLKWAIELSEFDNDFKPRTAIKAQALVDFIAELTFPEAPPIDDKATWIIYVDGSSNSDGSGARVIILSTKAEELKYSLCFEFSVINNDTEYEAVITGLGLATQLGVTVVKIHSDSQLVVGQVLEEYEAKDGHMAAYLMKVRDLQQKFKKVPRKERADTLARLASTNQKHLPTTANVQILSEPSTMLLIDVLELSNEFAR